jgi:ribosomal protein S18 acetylase RimI-like enzyme
MCRERPGGDQRLGVLINNFLYKAMSNNRIEISPATEDERSWAAGLLAGSEPWITLGRTYEHCYSSCTDPEFMVYVAHCEEKPCGAIILDPRGLAGSPYLKSLIVEMGYRSRGAGAALLEFAEDLFRPSSRHFFLCVSSFNIRAIAFYERHGYVKVGEFRDYIIEGESEILMHKRLR